MSKTFYYSEKYPENFYYKYFSLSIGWSSRKEKLEENTIYKKANKITIPRYCPLIVTKIKVKCNTTPFFQGKKGKERYLPTLYHFVLS